MSHFPDCPSCDAATFANSCCEILASAGGFFQKIKASGAASAPRQGRLPVDTLTQLACRGAQSSAEVSPAVLHELLKVIRQAITLDIAAGLNFTGDVRKYVGRPVLEGIEGNHADGIVKLPCQQLGDDALDACSLDFGFTAHPAEAVDNEKNSLVRAIRHGRERTHFRLLAIECGFKTDAEDSFRTAERGGRPRLRSKTQPNLIVLQPAIGPAFSVIAQAPGQSNFAPRHPGSP